MSRFVPPEGDFLKTKPTEPVESSTRRWRRVWVRLLDSFEVPVMWWSRRHR
jgi:hypothetical protein